MYDLPFLDLPPMNGAAGTVRLPGSKSISNRVLLLAGLAQGTTAVHDLLDSDDTRVMLAALQQLGCVLRHEGPVLHVTGLGGRLKVHSAELFLGNAGTAMRPLAAALAVLAATQGGCFELSGGRVSNAVRWGSVWGDILDRAFADVDSVADTCFPVEVSMAETLSRLSLLTSKLTSI